MRLVLAVLVLAALGLASCHDDRSPTRTAASTAPTIRAADLHGPGSPITDGLVVPAGAQLLGRVIHGPILWGYEGYSSRSGWAAVMTVSGDGRASFHDFISTAQKAGYVDDPSIGGPARCHTEDGAMVCTAYLTSPRGERVDVDSEVGRCGAQGTSHLVVSRSTPGEDLPSPTRIVKPVPVRSTTTTTENPEASATTSSSPRLPAPGQLLNPRHGYVIAPAYLQAGSRVVGPPMVSCDFHGLHNSVVQITDPVDQVFEAYAHQFATAAQTDSPTWRMTDHGVTITTVWASVGGGDSWLLTVDEQAGHPTYGLVQTITDP